MEAQWYAERTLLRTLRRTQPTWTLQQLADAIGRSLGWVKKWVKRLRMAPPHDDKVLHSRSCARIHPPPALSQNVIDRILEIRDHPPDHLNRTPGPKAILYYLHRDAALTEQRMRLPRSTRTIWQVLRAPGRIASPPERSHTASERRDPMASWELDFKDVTTVPPDADGKQQHVVEVQSKCGCWHLDPRRSASARGLHGRN